MALPATFALGDVGVESGVAANALFRDHVLLPYSDPSGSEYQAVHRGSVTITITPSDAAVAPSTVIVRVEDALDLGATTDPIEAELNIDIYEIAHRTGLLPQFIKAHAAKESFPRFNRLTYRYEPIGPSVGDLLAISRGPNLRTQSPYRDYRLATAADSLNAALPDGTLRSNADRDVRAGLVIECDATGAGGRPIAPSDVMVSAWEIFRCNDKRQNWTVRAGTRGPARVRLLQNDAFTAQTGLAASYGLLQMTYVTATDLKWVEASDGAKNPSLLLDTSENLARDAGSLNIGVRKVIDDFRELAKRRGQTTLSTPTQLLALMVRAWDLYNRGEKGYGTDVRNLVEQYLPAPQASVLGGS